MSDHLDMPPHINGQDSQDANQQNEFSEQQKRQMLQIWAKLKARNQGSQAHSQSPILSPTYIEEQAYRSNGYKQDREIESTTIQTINQTLQRNTYQQYNQPVSQVYQNHRQSQVQVRQRMEFLNSDNVRLFLQNRRLLNENIQLKEQNEQYEKDLKLTRSQLNKARQQLARIKNNSVSIEAFKSQMNKMATLLSERDKSVGKPQSPRQTIKQNGQPPRLSSFQRQQSPRNVRSPEARRSPIGNRIAIPVQSQRPTQIVHHIPQNIMTQMTQPTNQQMNQNHVQTYPQQITHIQYPQQANQSIPILQSQIIVPQQHIQTVQTVHPYMQKQQVISRPSGLTDRIMSPRSYQHQTPIARINDSEKKSPITQTTKASPAQVTKSDQIMNKLQNQLNNLRNLNTHLHSQPSKQTDKQRQLRNAKLIFQSENNNLKKQLADKQHKIGRLMSDLQRSRRNI